MDDHVEVGGEPPPERSPLRRIFLGLQFRFTVLVLGLTVGVAVLVGGLLVDLAGRFATRQETSQCLQLASLLARSSGNLLQLGDLPGLQALAAQSVESESVIFVAFTDPRGRVLAAADGPGTYPDPSRLTSYLERDTGILGSPVFVDEGAGQAAHLEVAYPVIAPTANAGGERPLLGYVRAGLSVQHTLRDLAAALDFFSGVSIAVLLVTVPLAYLVVRCVVVPLNDLSRVVRRFSEGELSARSRIRRGDEIGELATAFNSMADELARKHREIISLNADLEERVQRRTRQLRELAARDPLTGLYNRRYFGEVLQNRFSEARRYGTDLSCMMIDLDDFKSVNDRFGHHMGDELLILTSMTVASQLRAADVAARFGGDELVVLLPQTDARRAQVLAERVAEKYAQDLAEQMPNVRITLSIGIASVLEAAPDTPEELIRAADAAMYRAKDLGKSQIVTAGASAA